MFQIVAFLFAVSNGVAATESIASMRNPRHFATMEACQEYLDSDEGAAIQAMVNNTNTIKNHQAEVKFQCVKTGDPL